MLHAVASEVRRRWPDHHVSIGRYLRWHASSVFDARVREHASSGGLGRHHSSEILRTRMADRVTFVRTRKNRSGADEFPEYAISSDPVNVVASTKSAYHPITLGTRRDALSREDRSPVSMTIPCFAKALRNLAAIDESVAAKLKAIIGIFCDGMIGAGHAGMIGWQVGVHPDRITSMGFRQ